MTIEEIAVNRSVDMSPIKGGRMFSHRASQTSTESIRVWYFSIGFSLSMIGLFSLDSLFFGWSLRPAVRVVFLTAGILNLMCGILVQYKLMRRLAAISAIAATSARSFTMLVLGTARLDRGAEWASGATYITLSYASLFVYFVSVVVMDRRTGLRDG
jgi:hypothetical protein